jgi:hypothetical protein
MASTRSSSCGSVSISRKDALACRSESMSRRVRGCSDAAGSTPFSTTFRARTPMNPGRSFYDVIFTALVIGIFDPFVSARMLDRYPQLYSLAQKNVSFTRTVFWLWIGNALSHSLVRVLFFLRAWVDVCKRQSRFCLDFRSCFWGKIIYVGLHELHLNIGNELVSRTERQRSSRNNITRTLRHPVEKCMFVNISRVKR